jgi:hypothetical protein
MCSFPTSETGGLTPFQLKYGTEDAEYFRLPEELEPGARCHSYLKLLDQNLKIVREISLKAQKDIAEERRLGAGEPSKYEEGDLVLWNPKEKPTDKLDSKLTPPWFGPYEVISQVKNDVEVFHIVMMSKKVFHVSRLKPFFGTREEALEIAKLDKNQYKIESFNWFTGNPHVRGSLEFNVTFEDGTINMPYSQDLADSAQFDEYVKSNKILKPLAYVTVKESKDAIKALSKITITTVKPGDKGYLHLRYYDGRNKAWYDSVGFPEKEKNYVVEIVLAEWKNKTQTMIKFVVPILKIKGTLNAFDITTCVYTETEIDPIDTVVVTAQMLSGYKALSNL